MPETFANDAAGTLSAGIDASVTSLSLGAGQGAEFPTTGNFRIVIDDEIILVGARSTDTLSSLTRGAEGTTAASHSSGAAVTAAVTAGALNAIGDAVPWTLIQETILAADGLISFSSIPQTYKSLILDCTVHDLNNGEIWLRLNGSSASTYSWHMTNFATVTSSYGTTAAKVALGQYAQVSTDAYPVGDCVVRFRDYTKASPRKKLWMFDYAGWSNGLIRGYGAGYFDVAGPITSINLASSAGMAGTFKSGSSARLYGLPI